MFTFEKNGVTFYVVETEKRWLLQRTPEKESIAYDISKQVAPDQEELISLVLRSNLLK